MAQQDLEKIVEARCTNDTGYSDKRFGKHYHFNNKTWTKCPHIIYLRGRNVLELKPEKKEPKKAGK